MLLWRVYRVIAIYPKTMGKRQGINEQEILGNQSSTMQTRQRFSKSLNSIALNNFDLDYGISSTQKYIFCTIYEGEALFELEM